MINKIFTPTASEIEKAQLIIEEFKKSDTGLVVIDGKLIEKPVIRNMYRILEITKNYISLLLINSIKDFFSFEKFELSKFEIEAIFLSIKDSFKFSFSPKTLYV